MLRNRTNTPVLTFFKNPPCLCSPSLAILVFRYVDHCDPVECAKRNHLPTFPAQHHMPKSDVPENNQMTTGGSSCNAVPAVATAKAVASKRGQGAARRQKARRVSLMAQRDIVRLNRSQKLLREDPFGRPMGSEVVSPNSAVVVGCFVSHPRQDEVAVPPNPLLPAGSTEAPSSSAAKATREPQLFVRVQLGGQAEQLLPMAIMRREHPQLLIDYLLSTAHLM